MLAVATAVSPGTPAGLIVDPERAAELIGHAGRWPRWRLTRRQRCDLELLACGGFSPLRGFLGEEDYLRVCESMRLADGGLWPIPVTLDVPARVAALASTRGRLVLRDSDSTVLAVLEVDEVWRPDLAAEASAVFGTTDLAHPGAEHLLRRANGCYVAGRLEVLRLPSHPDFRHFRHTPARLRAEFAARGWQRVVAFQTRNPLHRVHQELTLRAAREADAQLLIHPVVGETKRGDVDHHTRVRCYRAILPHYPRDAVLLSLLPLAMRMAGPREALWHAIIRKNYGATHFIVGRDHAGPGPDSRGSPFYEPYAAQDLARRHSREVGIQILSFPRLVYVPDRDAYMPEEQAPAGSSVLLISGTELRQRLSQGRDLPAWFTPPEIAAELRRSYPARAPRPAATGAMTARRPDSLLTGRARPAC